jgi:hypothetical protein
VFVYAGIDEAGYGPMFGPLVIARSVFALQDSTSVSDPPSLWSLLNSVVCKRPGDKKRRIPINDSKILYQSTTGLHGLERGVLAFLNSAGIRPQSVQQLLEQLAFDAESCQTDLLWYDDPAGWPELPVKVGTKQLEQDRSKLRRHSSRVGVDLVDVGTAVVFEDRFNHLVTSVRSKAGCSWLFVAGHLRALWERFGRHRLWVVVDRQGGRKSYETLLAGLFPEAELSILGETPASSSYALCTDDRAMCVKVQVNSERFHLPVALASMMAKYVRELLMMRFQKFWQEVAPEVRPTFGYFGDGKRFLKEIEPLIQWLDIDRRTLVRVC